LAQRIFLYPHKSTRELRASLLLFRILSSSTIVRLALWVWKIMRFFRLPVSPLVRFTGYYQFCAGKNVVDSTKRTERMARFGLQSVLDYTNEHAKTEFDFDHNLKMVLQTIDEAKKNKAYPFAVVKPTAIGAFVLFEKMTHQLELSQKEKQSWENTKKRFEQLAQKAKDAKIVLMIDAEESWIQPGIDLIILPLMSKYNQDRVVVAITLQLYLKDKAEFYTKLLSDASNKNYHLGVKLVRGAYMEKERSRAQALRIASPICDTKAATDLQYRQVLECAVDHLNNHLCIVATHNEEDVFWAVNACAKKGVALKHANLWFSQLYGMRDYISFDLAAQGANVFKYVPFGPLNQSIPYLVRRALENSSMKAQTVRERTMLRQELKRRKTNA